MTTPIWHGELFVLDRPWDAPPQLNRGETTLALDWNDGALDMPLRLLGAVLGAEDLGEAAQRMGRSLEPELQTLAFIGDEVVFVVGGPMTSPTPHLFIERETYRLRAMTLPAPEGTYRVELDGYTLADGWFPNEIRVLLDDEPVLELIVESIRSR